MTGPFIEIIWFGSDYWVWYKTFLQIDTNCYAPIIYKFNFLRLLLRGWSHYSWDRGSKKGPIVFDDKD